MWGWGEGGETTTTTTKKVLKNLRKTSIVIATCNMTVMILGTALIISSLGKTCPRRKIAPFLLIMVAAGVRVLAMVRCAVLQQAAAFAILGSSPNDRDDDDDENSHSSNASASVGVVHSDLSRQQRRLRYKTWLWWTRFATAVTVSQFLLAMCIVYMVAKNATHEGTSNDCVSELLAKGGWWKRHLLFSFLVMVCFVAILQCFASSDVLRWRSFYEMQDNAWKAHYQEVFDHGIREALCCLGRIKYLKTLEDDEVYSVARLLGDLVTYRASGTGHLEFLAGLALLQRHHQSPKLDETSVDAPQDKIVDATVYHPFAEAAYTGPLLDVGRNPILFPCVWLYRQGILTSWSRNRRPVLQGDNWWRGHAAAFLRYVKLPPDCLRRGRVNQGKCQAAYFIVVLHRMRSVVIAVRGTETPEDLITDGLGRETSFTMEDLDGLINSMNIDPAMRHTVLSSFPHYGHSGIVEAARELHCQIEASNSGSERVAASESGGFLSSLLGPGCECEGYTVRIVGHSLGGSIAALLGMRLHGRFPDLHVYAYGPLPCVDSVVADACSSFVTSIVHDSEFSSFLSVNSMLRLRAAALTTISQARIVDTAMIYKLAQLFMCMSNYQKKLVKALPGTLVAAAATQRDTMNHSSGGQTEASPEAVNFDLGRYSFLDEDLCTKNRGEGSLIDNLMDNFSDPFATEGITVGDPVSQFMQAVPSSESKSADDPPEVYLPGFIIHLIRQQRGIFNFSPWKSRGAQSKEPPYRAIIADRENFKDILISPYMFLDHLPWRCQYALQRVLECWNVPINHDGTQFV